MGLEITAYENLIITNNKKDKEFYFSEKTFEQEDRIIGECFVTYDDACGFSAGSYRNYNLFRNILCESINNLKDHELWELAVKDTEKAKSLPFYWLINFSDCDGYIGSSFCEILYKNFCDYEVVFKERIKDEYFISIYNEFKNAFELSKNNGIIIFH